MINTLDSMPIQDVHLLLAQARAEADNPAFKVQHNGPMDRAGERLNECPGLFTIVRLHRQKVSLQALTFALLQTVVLGIDMMSGVGLVDCNRR